MQETPPEQIENDEKTTSKTEEIKRRPTWLRGLIYAYKKLLFLGLYVFVFFVNRSIFALTALASFNIILLIFVFVEWWFYHALVTEIIPNYFTKTPNSPPPNLTERSIK